MNIRMIISSVVAAAMVASCSSDIPGGTQADETVAEEVSSTIPEQRRVSDATNYKDPVCGMDVEPYAQYISDHAELTYGFCSANCRDRFEASPVDFVARLSD